jgi:ribosomal subunit interface protein
MRVKKVAGHISLIQGKKLSPFLLILSHNGPPGTIWPGKRKRRSMQIPLDVKFRNMDPSPAVEARIREKAEKLERFHDRIIGCTVVVEAPHRHHHKGKLYSVHIDISVPGKDLVVDRAKPANHSHEDVYVAVRDAFNAAVRRLEDHTQRMRGEVKTHASTQRGGEVPVAE